MRSLEDPPKPPALEGPQEPRYAVGQALDSNFTPINDKGAAQPPPMLVGQPAYTEQRLVGERTANYDGGGAALPQPDPAKLVIRGESKNAVLFVRACMIIAVLLVIATLIVGGVAGFASREFVLILTVTSVWIAVVVICICFGLG